MGATQEIRDGARFPFGENWLRFLESVDEASIEQATTSLAGMLEAVNLRGRRFLDAGSGSGLFSLAAARLGAEVVSFDLDPSSVACTEELRRRYGHEAQWEVRRGSVLDGDFLGQLGRFDVVYSWGVLHHTGRMWDACGRVAGCVDAGGLLYIALYNDQGAVSRAWTAVKRRYNQAGPWGKRVLEAGSHAYLSSRTGIALASRRIAGVEQGVGADPSGTPRGMLSTYDLRDWVGGYPFEVASPGAIFTFFHGLGFELQRMMTVVNGHGCNEYVFRRPADSWSRG